MSIETLLTFFTASLLLGLAPGPDNIFVLTQSMLAGKRAGILVTLGLCTGLLVHTAAVGLGFAAVLQGSPILFICLTYVGAGYLLWLAYQSFAASAAVIDAAQHRLGMLQLYL